MKGGKREGLGRPAGSKNKTTEEIRTFLKDMLAGRLDGIEADLDGMAPEQRMRYTIDILKFVVSPAIVPDKLSVEQLQQIVEYLESTYTK